MRQSFSNIPPYLRFRSTVVSCYYLRRSLIPYENSCVTFRNLLNHVIRLTEHNQILYTAIIFKHSVSYATQTNCMPSLKENTQFKHEYHHSKLPGSQEITKLKKDNLSELNNIRKDTIPRTEHDEIVFNLDMAYNMNLQVLHCSYLNLKN